MKGGFVFQKNKRMEKSVELTTLSKLKSAPLQTGALGESAGVVVEVGAGVGVGVGV